LLGLAFVQERGELLRPAMTDRIHQPYRLEMCPLLAPLLPLAGSNGVLGVALSGAGPSVLLILRDEGAIPGAEREIRTSLECLGDGAQVEILTLRFELLGAIECTLFEV
jgi:homoserine kinase